MSKVTIWKYRASRIGVNGQVAECIEEEFIPLKTEAHNVTALRRAARNMLPKVGDSIRLDECRFERTASTDA